MVAEALKIGRREYVLTILAAAYVLFRVIGFIGAEPRIFPDTGTYEHVARAPILSAEFIAGWRSPHPRRHTFPAGVPSGPVSEPSTVQSVGVTMFLSLDTLR